MNPRSRLLIRGTKQTLCQCTLNVGAVCTDAIVINETGIILEVMLAAQ